MTALRGVVCAAWVVTCFWSFSTHSLEAGAAKVELVPAEGVPLDGDFSRRGRPATGSRDPLHVRALFLQDDNAACFLVAADLFAITRDLRARVLEMAPAVVPRENIVLVATHTLHGLGGLDRSWLGRQRGGRFMPEHVEAVASTFAEAMQLAYDGRKRAAAGYASLDSALVVNRFDPLGPVDGRLSVLRVDDSDGNPIAILANFGVAPQNSRSMSFSADFPGAFCAALEAITASSSVAFFLNGASADQIPAPFDGGQPFAETVAMQVKSMVNAINCREVSLVFSSGLVSEALHSAAPFYPAELVIQTLKIDRLAAVFMPPIPYGTVSHAMRKAIASHGFEHTMIVAPANGYIGALASVDTVGSAEPGSEPVYLGLAVDRRLTAGIEALLTGTEPEPDVSVKNFDRTKLDKVNGVVHVTVAGSPDTLGAERGRVLRASDLSHTTAVLPAEWLMGAAAPVLGHWELLSSALAVETLARPVAGQAVRGLLRGVDASTVMELSAMAEAAHEPFADLWLRQLAPSTDAVPAAGPVGLTFVLSADDSGAVIGQSIEWPTDVSVGVVQIRPESGNAHLIAGLPWQVSGVCGVNDRGLAAAVAPTRSSPAMRLTVPVHVLVSELLASASSLDDAIAMLSIARPEFSGRVLLVHDDGKTSRTAIVDLGVLPSVVMDVATEVVSADDAPLSSREQRVRTLLDGLSVAEDAPAESILTDRDRRAAESDRVLQPATRASIVLVPRRHEIRVMAPENGTPRAFESITVRGDES